MDVSGAFDIVCLQPVAIMDPVANNTSHGVQFTNLYISFCACIAIDLRTLDGLMTNHIALDGAIGNDMAIHFHLEILCAVIAVAWKCYFDGRRIRRDPRRNSDHLFPTHLNDPNDAIIFPR